jgi:hypothetical protein
MVTFDCPEQIGGLEGAEAGVPADGAGEGVVDDLLEIVLHALADLGKGLDGRRTTFGFRLICLWKTVRKIRLISSSRVSFGSSFALDIYILTPKLPHYFPQGRGGGEWSV